MPQVGKRKFPYTKEGEQEAAAYAAETGQEVVQQDSYGYARGGMTGAMSEEDMALGHKASRGETGLMGKLKKLLRGEQVPFSEKLYNKMLSEDDREYFRLEELLGKDIMKQHAEIWGSKNPDSNLADFNKYVADWAADVDNVYLSDKTDEEYKAMGMQAGGMAKEVEWIPVTYQGEKFQFANTPETQKILSGSKFDSNEAFAQLIELGLMVPLESEGMQRGGYVGKFGY